MQEHITEKLSAYLHHELPKEERQAIAEHLLNCQNCRQCHDEIKFGAALAGSLQRVDAPESVWREIENALDDKKSPQVSLLPQVSFFNLKGLVAASAALLVVSVLAAIVYLNLFKAVPKEAAKNETKPIVAENSNSVEIVSIPNEPPINANVQTNASTNSDANIPLPNVNQIPQKPSESLSGWKVETVSGKSSKTELAVGEFLETDANSRVRIAVADIGSVEIAPNSRVKLVKTESTEHRLSLTRGSLQAKINAPPRLFIVDTPSAVAVDLGCEYTLEVDKAGNTKLHVTKGFVALEKNGRESIVPAGAICLTRLGKGLGTPFSEDASPEFQNALVQFDFQNGKSDALQTIIKEADFYDSLTLWHLLSRTQKADREKVFDALARYVKPPAGVTREGVLRLDKKMLDAWRIKLEKIWFE